MIMAAGKFIAAVADENGSRHQLEETAAAVTAEAALAHIGDRMTAMPLDERRLADRRGATKIRYGHRRIFEECLGDHASKATSAGSSAQSTAETLIHPSRALHRTMCGAPYASSIASSRNQYC